MTITVFYSCRTCGLARIPCAVPARREEGLRAWLGAVSERLTVDHRSRAPHCSTPELADLAIPMTGAKKVGGPPVN